MIADSLVIPTELPPYGLVLHIDMETRRTAAWPEDVAVALDYRIAADAWEP